jgi:menaquinone-9 beta-reductase
MVDVLIVGAGPAGAVAGVVLARAGVRVRILDRATFPRDKLCGDTVNPGALARLEQLGLADMVHARGLRVDGMQVTGERGIAIEGRYPDGLYGRAIIRRELDSMLLDQAIAAGCELDPGVFVRGAIVSDKRGRRLVTGVTVGGRRSEQAIEARVIIAADGRRSTLAFGLGLARHPARPRRWAIGGYFENFGVRHASGTSLLGEMHVRRGRYIGVAPIPGGLTNVCLVRPLQPGDAELRDPSSLLMRELRRDLLLRDRAAGARLVSPPVVLGPLAVDVRAEAIDGLLLAGDAAGFIDPMTGDGLRFAIRGAELAAAAAMRALQHGWPDVQARLAADRRAEFNGKWRFNRTLRAIVASPRAVAVAAFGARLAPAVLRATIARAGDCDARLK